MTNHLHWRIVGVMILLALAGLACSVSVDPGGSAEAGAVETQVAATLQAIAAGEAQQSPPEQQAPENESAEPAQSADPTGSEVEPEPVLPATVYYLAGEPERAQVYRLERDGVTTRQVTAEASRIEAYDVSPVDGAVVYLINNQIYIINADGSGRTLLLDGGLVDENAPGERYEKKLGTPRWSPDGAIIAYYHGGLNFYNLSDGATQRLLDNRVDELEGGHILPQELYFVGEWSPDGQDLMLNIGWMEGGTIGVYDIASDSLIQSGHAGIFCCYDVWTPDSRAVLVASDVIGMISSGLWRMDAATGSVQTLLDTQNSDESFNYVAGPHQMPNGDLRYFYLNSPRYVDGDVALQLVHSASDGVTGRQVLVGEAMVIYDALWAPDGSVVLVVEQPSPDDNSYPPRGILNLVDPENGQVQALLQDVSTPRWGN